MIKTLIATTALVTLATAAHAGTYRLDVSAAEGVKFAPWANEAAVDVNKLAINGDPKVADNSIFSGTGIPGVVSVHDGWYIFEADQGTEYNLIAMDGKTNDEIGRISFTIPSDGSRPIIVVDESKTNTSIGEEVVEADRMINGVVMGYDVGADEGTEMETAVADKGTWTLTELGK